jgi:REP element-mobilizing transposase RayT
MQKFQGKYRIETARAQWWNYSNEGEYFITICTKNREHLFGYIQDYEMILNEYGQIVSDCWYDLPKHYHNIVLGEFQIMPNHIHCIVGVDNSTTLNPDSDKKNHGVFEFMRALKSFSSRGINEKRNSKGVSNWQERFHDHIIRNEAEYNRIRNYIINNPKNWNKDCFFSSDT